MKEGCDVACVEHGFRAVTRVSFHFYEKRKKKNDAIFVNLIHLETFFWYECREGGADWSESGDVIGRIHGQRMYGIWVPGIVMYFFFVILVELS